MFPRAIGVGESFGVMLLRSGGATFEIATFRTDGGYLDGHHPTEVRFAGAEEDARRRDFTINGLFERPESGEVVDFVGGRGDLEARLLRAIGDPAARLAEDRLRALRAVRFAARFELSVDPATETAILALDGDLFGVSRERLGQELRRMFFERHRSRAASLLERWGLDRVLLGARGDSEEQRRLASLPADASPMTSLAAWLLDRGESTDPIAVAERLQGGLGLSNAEREELAAVLRSVESLRHEWGRAGIARRRRLGMEPGFDPRGGFRAGASVRRPARGRVRRPARGPAALAGRGAGVRARPRPRHGPADEPLIDRWTLRRSGDTMSRSRFTRAAA
ncbi:MAG: CCA-adding enzyme [Planctomycetota bacterium]